VFAEASRAAEEVLALDWEMGQIVYNKFKSAIAYETTASPIVSPKAMATSGVFSLLCMLQGRRTELDSERRCWFFFATCRVVSGCNGPECFHLGTHLAHDAVIAG
jgi:hypothetical protein